MDHASASTFRTTSWTIIRNAPHSSTDMELLLQRYRDPIYAYFKRLVKKAELADDLTQEFIRKKVLEGNLLQRVDDSRRFRTFLCKALDNFARDKFRQERGRNQTRPTIINACDDLVQARQAADESPGQAYDRQWATTIFSQMYGQLESQCNENGMAQHWAAFEARHVRPALYRTEPASVELLAREMNLSASRVSHMIETVIRKARSLLRETVAETLDDPADLDDEIKLLRQFLG